MDTAADAITIIEDQLRDAGVQWVEAKQLRYLDEGQQRIYSRHPEAAQTDDSKVLTSAPSAISATTDSIGIRRDFQMALVYYVCWQALLENSDDEANIELANIHKQNYAEAMQ